jgi:hypothetical protein
MEFFGYFQQGETGSHDYPELLFKIRETYKRNLVDPTGGKEPLKYREYLEANVDTISKNSKYKDEYRKKKLLRVENKVTKALPVYKAIDEIKIL